MTDPHTPECHYWSGDRCNCPHRHDQVYVEIVPYHPQDDEEDDPGFRRMGPMTRAQAEKVDRGANINLDHERYYTRTVEAADA